MSGQDRPGQGSLSPIVAAAAAPTPAPAATPPLPAAVSPAAFAAAAGGAGPAPALAAAPEHERRGGEATARFQSLGAAYVVSLSCCRAIYVCTYERRKLAKSECSAVEFAPPFRSAKLGLHDGRYGQFRRPLFLFRSRVDLVTSLSAWHSHEASKRFCMGRSNPRRLCSENKRTPFMRCWGKNGHAGTALPARREGGVLPGEYRYTASRPVGGVNEY